MKDDAIAQFVKMLLHEKGIDTTVDQEVLDELVKTMSDQLEEYINRALIERLNDEQIKVFDGLLDKENNVDEINNFFYNSGINTQEVTIQAFQRFRDAYLGANTTT